MSDLVFAVLQGCLSVAFGWMGVEMTNNQPQTERDRTKWRKRFCLLSTLGFLTVITQGIFNYRKQAEDAQKEKEAGETSRKLMDYTTGGAYPKLSVELYFGPTNGMPHTLTTNPVNPGFGAYFVENTNDFPIYDFQISMTHPTNSYLKLPIIGKQRVPIVMFGIPNTNDGRISFRVDTRAKVTLHNFNFRVVNGQWEHSNNIVEIGTDKIITNSVSNGFK
jgi:hypothetical protein